MTDMPETPSPEKPPKRQGNVKGSKRGPYRPRTNVPPVEVTAEESFATFNARKYLMEIGHSMTADMVRGLLAATIQHTFEQLPGIQIKSPFDLTLMLAFFEGLTRVVHEVRGEMIKDRAAGSEGNVVPLSVGIGKFNAKHYGNGNGADKSETNGGGEPKPNGNGAKVYEPGWS